MKMNEIWGSLGQQNLTHTICSLKWMRFIVAAFDPLKLHWILVSSKNRRSTPSIIGPVRPSMHLLIIKQYSIYRFPKLWMFHWQNSTSH
jgi:hypothetical protein